MSKDYKETKSSAIYTMIARMFGWIYEIESKKYRRSMSTYFYHTQHAYETNITSVRSFKKKDKTILRIETHRPGLLIGKAGVFIDGLRQHLIDDLKEDIEIDLQECKLWHKLYSN